MGQEFRGGRATELLAEWCRVEIDKLSWANCQLLGLPSSTWLPMFGQIMARIARLRQPPIPA